MRDKEVLIGQTQLVFRERFI